jgi:hypothetical protein
MQPGCWRGGRGCIPLLPFCKGARCIFLHLYTDVLSDKLCPKMIHTYFIFDCFPIEEGFWSGGTFQFHINVPEEYNIKVGLTSILTSQKIFYWCNWDDRSFHMENFIPATLYCRTHNEVIFHC